MERTYMNSSLHLVPSRTQANGTEQLKTSTLNPESKPFIPRWLQPRVGGENMRANIGAGQFYGLYPNATYVTSRSHVNMSSNYFFDYSRVPPTNLSPQYQQHRYLTNPRSAPYNGDLNWSRQKTVPRRQERRIVNHPRNGSRVPSSEYHNRRLNNMKGAKKNNKTFW